MDEANTAFLSKEQLRRAQLGLLAVLCNATGIYRGTISKDKKKKFQLELIKVIEDLIEKIDAGSLKNKDVRATIISLSEKVGISIGAAQKAINVYLKYYCLIANKGNDTLRELDCPIDSWVISKYRLKQVSLKHLGLQDYEEMQDKLGREFGMRIIADIEVWDKKKLEQITS